MNINMERLTQVQALMLSSGSHEEFTRGMCVMEAVSYVAGDAWSDSPECASPVIAAFLRSWNDSLGDEPRNRLLKPLIPQLIGTRASAEVEEFRSYMALDWLIRVFTPKWLDMAPALHEHAKALRELEAIADMAGAAAAGKRVNAARAAAWAAAGDAASATAWDAAGDAAWAAAGDAARAAAWAAASATAWDAAGAAAGDAAGDAASAAAWAAARDAARAAAWAAAGDAARAAARAAARDAAWAAAGDAAGDAASAAAWAAARAAARAAAGDAAGDAASAAAWAAARDAARAAASDATWAALKPTTEWLQASALDLVSRMIATGSKP